VDLRSPPAAAAQRPWQIDADAIGGCAPIVVLLAVGTLRKGAFFQPDVVVLPCLCLALALLSPAIVAWLRAHPLPALAGVAATAWWIIDAAIWRHGVESWRLASTGVCAAAGYGVARSLSPASRKLTALAVTVIGVALSLAGLFVVATRSTTWTWPDERSLRFQGPLTYPSAIGLYLLITLLASLEVWRRGDEVGPPRAASAWLAPVARTLIVLGVVSTDSRGALAGLVVLLCFRVTRRELGAAVVAAVIAAPVLLYAQRDGVRPALVVVAAVVAVVVAAILGLSGSSRGSRVAGVRMAAVGWAVAAIALGAAGWLLATQHHDVSGFDASWTERGHILRGAVDVFGAHPLLGAGPDPSIPTTTLAGLPGIDAFAHNEPLEILLSVGIVGAIVLAAAAVIVARSLWPRRADIAMPVLATVAAAGLVDFVWHFPSLGLLAGVVAGVATSRASRMIT